MNMNLTSMAKVDNSNDKLVNVECRSFCETTFKG